MRDASPSITLLKALDANSTANQFQALDVLSSAPSTTFGSTAIYDGGAGGASCPYRLKLFPYCEGPDGAQFQMRLIGWEHVGNDSATLVWIPFLIAEFTCTSCKRPGPPPNRSVGAESVRLMKDSERLCDTIILTNGAVGQNSLEGNIYSTGPGTDLVAMAMVDLCGCKKFQFDFQQIDPVGMNCFWARA